MNTRSIWDPFSLCTCCKWTTDLLVLSCNSSSISFQLQVGNSRRDDVWYTWWSGPTTPEVLCKSARQDMATSLIMQDIQNNIRCMWSCTMQLCIHTQMSFMCADPPHLSYCHRCYQWILTSILNQTADCRSCWCLSHVEFPIEVSLRCYKTTGLVKHFDGNTCSSMLCLTSHSVVTCSSDCCVSRNVLCTLNCETNELNM